MESSVPRLSDQPEPNLRGDLAPNISELDPVLRQIGNLVHDLVVDARPQQKLLGITGITSDIRVMRDPKSGDRSLAFGLTVMGSAKFRVRIEKAS